jgi:hypothetical protein
MLKAQYLYAGYSDYFGGYGCDDDEYHSEHLLYAFYGRGTTLRDIIDQLVEDSWNGPAGETLPEDTSQDDVRTALLCMLNCAGRSDYDSGALAACAAGIEAPYDCPDCGTELVGDVGQEECPDCGEYNDDEESPIFVVVLEYIKPEELSVASDCLSYGDDTGCSKCTSYDDCGDREDNPERDAE